jgi:hypothetical protein
LNDYVDRLLPGQVRAEVAAHLPECPACHEEVRELEATVALLRRLPDPEPPPGLAESVMARVRAGEAEPASWLRSLGQIFQPALTVTATAAVAGLTVFAVARDPGLSPDSAVAPIQLAQETAPATPPASPTQVARVTPPAAPVPSSDLRLQPRTARPAAPDSSLQVAVAPPLQLAENRRIRGRYGNEIRRRSRAFHLAQFGHREEMARTLRGAGHPHSARFADYFEDYTDSDRIQLTSIASQAR